MMIIAIGFLLFLAISPCYPRDDLQKGSRSNSGAIKICVVDNDTDTSWMNTIDSLILFIAKNHIKSPQVYRQGQMDICEFVGSVDRAKMRADFILVVKKHNKTQLDCDPEWGRHGFGLLNFYPEMYKPIDKAYGNIQYVAKLAYSSTEDSKKADEPIKWKNVNSTKNLLRHLKRDNKLLAPQSRIPDDYPFKAEREERVKRRTLKAVIALMGLAVCSLLVIMFLGSLSRYNESKKQKEQDLEKKKKHEQQAVETNPQSSKKNSDASEKTEKTEKSKSAKSEKSTKKEEKEPLIDKSKKSEKASEKKSKKD